MRTVEVIVDGGDRLRCLTGAEEEEERHSTIMPQTAEIGDLGRGPVPQKPWSLTWPGPALRKFVLIDSLRSSGYRPLRPD